MPIVSLNLSDLAYTVYRNLPNRQRSRILSKWIVASREKSDQVEELSLALNEHKNVIHLQKMQIDRLRDIVKELDPEYLTGRL
jgi:acyl-CoA reductase-like NAD-dependent aldehyde dehydrogenase